MMNANDDDTNIKLRLGNVVYHTKRSVLLRDRDSMLAAMFSSQHCIQPSIVMDDGVYVIRGSNPYLFAYILRFLQLGCSVCACKDEEESNVENFLSNTNSYSESSSSSTGESDDESSISSFHGCSILEELTIRGLEMLEIEADYFQMRELKNDIQIYSTTLKDLEKRKTDQIEQLSTNVSELKCEIEELKLMNARLRRDNTSLKRLPNGEYETSMDGCLIELKEAKEGDTVIVGEVHKGKIISINAHTSAREAQVQWSRPPTYLERMTKIFKLISYFLLCSIIVIVLLVKERYLRNDDGFRDVRVFFVFTMLIVPMFLFGRDDIWNEHYITQPCCRSRSRAT